MTTTGQQHNDTVQSWLSQHEALPDWGTLQDSDDYPRSGGVSRSGSVQSSLSASGNVARNQERVTQPESRQVVNDATSHGRSSPESATGMRRSDERPRATLGASSEAASSQPSQPSRTWGPRPTPSRRANAPDKISGGRQTAARGRDTSSLELAPSTVQSAMQVSRREQPSTPCT
jgi:hypothetical protein